MPRIEQHQRERVVPPARSIASQRPTAGNDMARPGDNVSACVKRSLDWAGWWHASSHASCPIDATASALPGRTVIGRAERALQCRVAAAMVGVQVRVDDAVSAFSPGRSAWRTRATVCSAWLIQWPVSTSTAPGSPAAHGSRRCSTTASRARARWPPKRACTVISRRTPAGRSARPACRAQAGTTRETGRGTQPSARRSSFADRHAQDRMLGAFKVVEQRRVLAQELLRRDAMDARHLGRVRPRRRAAPGPHHHRRDHVARARGVVVEAAQHRTGRQVRPDLFTQLAQRGLLRRLAIVERPPGIAHWPACARRSAARRVSSNAVAALHCGCPAARHVGAVAGFGHRHRHRCAPCGRPARWRARRTAPAARAARLLSGDRRPPASRGIVLHRRARAGRGWRDRPPVGIA